MNVQLRDEETAPQPEPGRRLDSWKEIAAYLKRDVATARRWEKREGLPVHRHLHEKLGSVFAHTSELDAWAESRRRTLEATSADDELEDAPPASRSALPWSVAGALAIVLAGVLVVWAPWRDEPAAPPLRFAADLGAVAPLAPSSVQFGDSTAVSPDGTTVAFVGQTGDEPLLYVRRLSELQATPLSGTEGAIAPFFSPDNSWIGFFAAGKLKKVAAGGGAPVPLADTPSPRGGHWSDDGSIVFSPHRIAGTQILRVPSTGGAAVPLTTLEGDEVIHLWPQALPGGKSIIYTAGNVIGAYNDAKIVAQSLATGARKVVQSGGYHARYLASGHLVFVRDATLFAAPFDVDRLEVTGTPVPALRGLASNVQTGGAQFSAAANGTLLYLAGQATGALPVYWMDRDGRTEPLRGTPVNWMNPRFAPDGRQLALDVRDGASHIWIADWASQAFTRLSRDPDNEERPVWTDDGRHIVFSSTRAGRTTPNLYSRRADGSGDAERLTESNSSQQPASWHPGGRALAFEEINTGTRADIMILPFEGRDANGWKMGKPQVFLNASYPEYDPMFSPDGEWLAYTSMETGRPEVYVRRFPDGGGKVHVGVGANPVWSRARPELLYGNSGQIMVAGVAEEGRTLRVAQPRPWNDARYQTRGTMRMFDLHPKDERFALAPAPSGARQDMPVFVLNFFEELRRALGNRE